jgi:hypothetical protein
VTIWLAEDASIRLAEDASIWPAEDALKMRASGLLKMRASGLPRHHLIKFDRKKQPDTTHGNPATSTTRNHEPHEESIETPPAELR